VSVDIARNPGFSKGAGSDPDHTAMKRGSLRAARSGPEAPRPRRDGGLHDRIAISEEIESLTLDGLEADAITRQHLVRMQLRSDHKVHHVETWVTQRERWWLTPDGWKLAKVDDVRDQRRLVDGPGRWTPATGARRSAVSTGHVEV
jgi:hypothetical protein